MSQVRDRRAIGVIPAAGTASRLGRLPCSKELLPIDLTPGNDSTGVGPRVAAHFLLDGLRKAGAGQAVIVLCEGKEDIPVYFGDGSRDGIGLTYANARTPFGVPYSVDAAFDVVKNSVVLFGFPDIVFEPVEALAILLEDLEAARPDIVLGLFPARSPHKMDMVRLDSEGMFAGLEIKPPSTMLTYTWILAAWQPRFTCFLHDWVRESLEHEPDGPSVTGREPFLGDVVVAAWKNGLTVGTRILHHGTYIDIGTPEELRNAVLRYSRTADEPEPGAHA